MGPFWKRPSDVTLGRLTDIWHLSQPPHLRHLAIVRDTALAPRGKQTHYQYRSFRNFQRAVEAGDTAWQAVMFAQEGGKNGPRPVEDVVFERPDLDEWGFPKVDPKQFLGKNGVASLKECHDVVPMKSTHKSVRCALMFRGGALLNRPSGLYRCRVNSPTNPVSTPRRTRLRRSL